MISVVKVGGNVVDNADILQKFIKDFSEIDHSKILVHGGGKIATQMAQKLDVESQMIEGRRITNAGMLDVVTMVYGGLVNKKIVAALQHHQTNAIGLTGADGNAILAHKRTGTAIDYGFVGDIDQVNDTLLLGLLKEQMCPVMAPITHDGQGQLLNTNADTLAATVAFALAQKTEVRLVYCFEKPGVLMNADDDTTVIPTIDAAYFEELKAKNIVHTGMIPKLQNALESVKNGVKEVVICHAFDIKAAVAGTAGTKII